MCSVSGSRGDGKSTALDSEMNGSTNVWLHVDNCNVQAVRAERGVRVAKSFF